MNLEKSPSSNTKQMATLACVLIIVLRMSIGWQFLYEGLWKLDSQSSTQPWTSAGYLKNSQGPMRGVFRTLNGDPLDEKWLDVDIMSAAWDDWQNRFESHYGLNENQKNWLNTMLNGSKVFVDKLEKLPPGVDLKKAVGTRMGYNTKRKLLWVEGKRHITPRERDKVLALVSLKKAAENRQLSTADQQHNKLVRAFQKSVKNVFARQSRNANADRIGISFKERLGASLHGDPERAGVIQDKHKDTIDYKRLGDIELYREKAASYERNLKNAQQAFQFEHLANQHAELMRLKNEVIGPIRALDAELKTEAKKLLAIDQLARGPVSLPLSRQDLIDIQTMWGLTLLGLMLIIGFCSRTACIAGTLMLLMFYLAAPPWPGIPPAAGLEHSFIINKNLIEMIALLTIACFPTGRWFGVDARVSRFILRKRSA